MSTRGAVAHDFGANGAGHVLGRFWAWLTHHTRWAAILGWTVALAALVTIPVQLLYPHDRALPMMSLGGLPVGGKDAVAITALLDEYAQTGEVTITTPSKQWQAKWQDIGLTIDRTASAEAVMTYPTWERAIPLSSAIKVSQARQLPFIAIVDQEALTAFAEKLMQEDKLAASDATISIKDGQVVIDEAKNGYAFTADDVKHQIRRVAVTANAEVHLVPEQVTPVRSASALQSLKDEANAVLAHTPTLKIADKTYTPDKTAIGAWITFAENPDTKQLALSINREAVKQYLEGIDKEIKIEPGLATVTLVDGYEISRTGGSPGRTVAVDSSIDEIVSGLTKEELAPAVELKMANVPTKIQYVRTYSQSNEGLMAIIRDWEASAPGDYGVVIRELGGEKRYAEWQPDKKFVTASTFKMFVAYALLTKISQGHISYGQTTDIGWTVDACLTEMIINSTNPCAVSFLNLMGWQNVQDMVSAAGFSSTLINNTGNQDKHSTARDEANFLLRLNAGTLMDEAGTNRLLDMFKRQVWRGGIPSGVPKGVVVADKVGFYNGYVHDVAIVYAPKGTFILAIMSRGGSNPYFADLAKRVYNFFQN